MAANEENKTFLEAPFVEGQIKDLLRDSKENALFAVAFCKASVLSRLVTEASHLPTKSIIVRWSPEDLLRGVSDLAAYTVAKENDWQFFINLRLHAKVYLFDNQTAVLGSANLTERGLAGLPNNSNIEMSCLCTKVDESLIEWKDSLLQESCLVDDALFEKISLEISRFKKAEEYQEPPQFSEGLISQINAQASFELFTEDFPWCSSPDQLLSSDSADGQHDRKLLGLPDDYTLDEVRTRFAYSKPFLWLNNACPDEIYFGALTAKLHNDLKDDPRPYRKTVKGLLQNLIDWVAFLYPEQFAADNPSHSTRLRRIASS
jgi:hypothetical protein